MPIPYYRLRVLGHERAYPNVLEIGTFIWDLSTLYELVRFSMENPTHRLTRWDAYRNRKRLPEDEKLRLERLSHGSPIDLILVLNAVKPYAGKALDVFLKLVEAGTKTMNLGLQRKKLEEIDASRRLAKLREPYLVAMDEEKLAQERTRTRGQQLENLSKLVDIGQRLGVQDLQRFIEENDREEVLVRLQKRIGNSPVRVQHVDVEYKELEESVDHPSLPPPDENLE